MNCRAKNLAMLRLTQRLPANAAIETPLILALTAEERTRSRHHFTAPDGQSFYVQLPRGTVLRDGDLLQAETGEWVRVVASPEPVLTVTSHQPLDLLRAAYHLGNRHVALEVTSNYLRLLPDPVLQSMLEHMSLHVIEEVQPFQPETGAYGSHHSHGPDHE